ncbi:MAG: HlyC/CorC family transporter, partial [Candidatus Aminicenantes bacterium]|nr:HlyC/CorC family transporter [Candidatus Aminicenantes bacterium]
MSLSDMAFTLLGITLLLLCSAFFSSTETALSALSKIQILRIRKDKRKSSKAIVRFLDEPRRLFISVLFGNTLVNMAFVSITGSLIYNNIFKGKNAAVAYVAAILSQTLVLLIFGEITPKTFAVKHSVKLSRSVASPLWLFSQIIFPFRKILRLFTDILLPFFGVRSVVDKTPITSEEIKASVRATEESGALSPKEGELLYNIFDLQDTRVREVMTPRTQMRCVEVSETIKTAFNKAKSAGHSRLPVYRNEIDNICGIFNVKDLPRWKRTKVDKLGKKSLEELSLDEFLTNQDILGALNPEHKNTLIRPPFFVYKTRDIGSLMREMNKKKQHMAVILDEYGGVSGLVTVEDIVEEVVGEIADEYDPIPYKKITRDSSDPMSYIVPG